MQRPRSSPSVASPSVLRSCTRQSALQKKRAAAEREQRAKADAEFERQIEAAKRASLEEVVEGDCPKPRGDGPSIPQKNEHGQRPEEGGAQKMTKRERRKLEKSRRRKRKKEKRRKRRERRRKKKRRKKQRKKKDRWKIISFYGRLGRSLKILVFCRTMQTMFNHALSRFPAAN